MGKFIELIPYEEAVSRIKAVKWAEPETETIRTDLSSGRITGSEITSKNDVPQWNRSLVDGYAVRSTECRGASETNPVVFGINGTVEAGSSSYSAYREGHCTIIYTGGLLPPDYDSVVMAEDVDARDGSVGIHRSVKPGENVEMRGDDLRSSSRILGKSEIIRPWHISALIDSGVLEVDVFKKLDIGVIATGNELFEGSQGHIPNTTQKIYLDYLKRPFLNAEDAGIAHDSAQEIRRLVENALEKYDCVIVTGGTSLGGKDEVPEAMAQISKVVFAGSMIRPGRTLTLYEVKGKPVFSVSGIPVPSLLSFDLYFEEYLSWVTGLKAYRQPITGILKTPLSNVAGYTGIYRITYTADPKGGTVDIVRRKGSGSLGSILDSNGTLLVPSDVEGITAGSTVVVKLYGDST